MNRTFIVLMLFTIANIAFAQKPVYESWKTVAQNRKGQLNVMYFNNYPFAFTDNNNKTVGIEVGILNQFATWLKEYKGVDLTVKYKSYTSFDMFYSSIRDGGNGMVGAGSVTINDERKKEVKFSAPYLKNVAVLVSSLELPQLENMEQFPEVFKNKVALVVKGSAHEAILMDVKNKHFPAMKISYVASPKELLMKMKEDPNAYGYVDLITFWAFTEEQGGILQMHRAADQGSEKFGFIFPPNSDWNSIFREFMLGGFGFTSTVEYHNIIEQYLKGSITSEIEIK